MRASEILGLRGEYIYDEYIHICAQYDEYGYRPTKTKEKRNIPLAPVIINDLRRLASENNNGYVFSLDGGDTPVTRKLMYNKFHRALRAIGMTQDEIKRRGLSMHSWLFRCCASNFFFQHDFADGKCGLEQGTVRHRA